VAALQAALEEQTRERLPIAWAKTQSNLGNALAALGERETGTARLEEAVAAFRAALEESTRERGEVDWAATYGSQGVALMLIADRNNDAAGAEAALTQIRTAYETLRSAGHVPLTKTFLARLAQAQAIRDRLASSAKR
jgi:hypothetical protein